MKKKNFVDYHIRLWGNTAFFTDNRRLDYAIDNGLDMYGLQFNATMNKEQEAKLISLMDNAIQELRKVEDYIGKINKSC